MTHLQWLCELKRYLCYICRSSYQVILGRVQWNGPGGVVVSATQRIEHPNYNSDTLINDIALLRIPFVTLTSKYPSPVLTWVVVCVVWPHMIGVTTLWLLHILGVDTHMVDSVTHNDQVIITKGGQQTGPTINPLTPNDHYSAHTAPLTSKHCILYIYSTNIGTEYFKHGIYSPFFFSLS